MKIKVPVDLPQGIGTIHQKLNGTESQRTPFSKLLELLDTQVSGSVQWVLLEISWKQFRRFFFCKSRSGNVTFKDMLHVV